jgi:hypothetical protein
MFRRCLFCRARFPKSEVLMHTPRGSQIAYDPERGRLWVVCDSCHRWNLVPVDERESAIDELERLARDRGRTIARTAHVALLDAGPLTLVRVGGAGLAERAAWRYGRELADRRAAYRSAGSRVAAYTLGVFHGLGSAIGLADEDLSIDWRDAPVADVMRWRRFGWAAWHGRETCTHCLSTLRALRYDMAWWCYPIVGPDGRVGVGVPCQRCDPWTPEKLHRLHADVAENVLRRLLAYVNVGGASERRLGEAVDLIERAGSAEDFASESAGSHRSLFKIGRVGVVGLEIALGEVAEARMLELGARAIEFVWRREEELARIQDEELTPRRVLEAHLRALAARQGVRRLEA